MNDTIKALLKAAGYDKETIEAVSKDELPDDFDLDTVLTSTEESNKERHFKLFKNNEEFKNEIIKENDGKWSNTLNSTFKKLNIDLEEVKDKSLLDKLKYAAEVLNNQAEEKYKDTGKKASEEVKELQQQIVEFENKIQEVEQAKEEAVKEAEENATRKIVESRVGSDLKTEFSNIPSERLITKKHTDGVYTALTSMINSKYDAYYNDDNELSFKLKGKEQQPTGKVDGKEVILSRADIFRQELEGLGFWVESNGAGGTPPPNPGVPPSDKKFKESVSEQVDAISANLSKFTAATQ